MDRELKHGKSRMKTKINRCENCFYPTELNYHICPNCGYDRIKEEG